MKIAKRVLTVALAVAMMMGVCVTAKADESYYHHLSVKAVCEVDLTVGGITYKNIVGYIPKETLNVTVAGTKYNFADASTIGELSALAEHQLFVKVPAGLDVKTFWVDCDILLDPGATSIYGLYPFLAEDDGYIHVQYSGYYKGINECTNGAGLRSTHMKWIQGCPNHVGNTCGCPITGYDLLLKVCKSIACPEKPDCPEKPTCPWEDPTCPTRPTCPGEDPTCPTRPTCPWEDPDCPTKPTCPGETTTCPPDSTEESGSSAETSSSSDPTEESTCPAETTTSSDPEEPTSPAIEDDPTESAPASSEADAPGGVQTSDVSYAIIWTMLLACAVLVMGTVVIAKKKEQ